MMPITIKCPNESCAKSFRVQDAAAGKTGKCPVCGTRIVVPALAPDLGAASDEFAVLKPVAPPAAPYRPPGPGPLSLKPQTAVVAWGMVRFEAIGEAWRLFKQHAGVWIAATLMVGFGSFGLQVVLNLLSIPISIVGGRSLPGISVVTSLGSMAVSMAVWGIFLGGLFGMALKQVDGRPIGVKDLMPDTDILPGLAIASVLASLATLVGLLCLVIPGWIIAGLFLFTLPLVVDRRLKAIDALGTSWTTLKSQWLQAVVFFLVLSALQIAGLMLCLLGTLVTFPLCILSQAVLYRGFFAGDGAPAKPVHAIDPDFGPVGVETGVRPKGRIPVWAWLVAVTGVLAPVVAFAGAVALMVAFGLSAFRANQQNARGQQAQAFEKAFSEMAKRGQGMAPVPGPGRPRIPAQGKEFGANLDGPDRAFAEAKRKMIEAREKAGVDRVGDTMKPAGPNRRQSVAQRGNDTRNGAGAGAGVTNASTVSAIIRDVTSDNDVVRSRALDRLARSSPDPAHHDRVVKALEPLLVDPAATTRASAVKALAAWANPDDIPTLISALEDQDVGVRRAAIQALGRIKDERTVEPVARLMADSNASVHNDAVRALRQMGSIAEAEVVKYVDSNDVRTRERACQVLQIIGTKKSIRALTRAAAAKSASSRPAQAALKAINTREGAK
jgi:hypothetical protein